MKATFILTTIMVLAGMISCQKDRMMVSGLDVNINKYSTQLKSDYNSALINHNLSASAGNNSDAALYNISFHKNDSLFSVHFYEFCIDFMKNSGMMSGSDGMMGSNHGMMSGDGGMTGGTMMNGSVMGSSMDMNNMMNLLDSLHNSDMMTPDPDYFVTDSLMFNQMNLCKMMVSQTDSVTAIYDRMQLLRKSHSGIINK